MLSLTLLLTLAQIPAVEGPQTELVRMRYTEVSVGTGEAAKPGQEYTVHYTGWLTDGKKFDSSVDRKDPLKFVQGRRRVIAGWEAGFEGMKVGGKRRLFIPYQMAYGEAGRGSIPPKAELIFDVELLGVKDVPPAVGGIDVINPFEEYAKKTLELVKAMPDEKLDWRPSEGVRSVREVALHVALETKILVWVATDNPPADLMQQRFADIEKREKAVVGKAELVGMLEESFESVRKVLVTLRAAQLDREMPVFGQPSTMRGIYVLIDTHMAEHLGQLIAYGRINGVVPPWSQH
jgi:uncharacterized damage-inducible protein DinB